MNAIVEASQPATQLDGASALIPRDMESAVRLAQMMAKGKLVPQHLQDSPADCLMVIEQAARWRMSPFAVAQATSVVRGKLMYEGKLVAAVINNSGLLVGRLQYEFRGGGGERTVIVSALLRGEASPRTVEVTIKNVMTDNAMWTKQPDQQLCYSGARVWGRRHTPEVMLGVYVPEEDFVDDTETQRTERPPVEMPKQLANNPSPTVEQTVTQEKEVAPAERAETTSAPTQEATAEGSTARAADGQKKFIERKCLALKVDLAEICKEVGIHDYANLSVDGFTALKDALAVRERAARA